MKKLMVIHGSVEPNTNGRPLKQNFLWEFPKEGDTTEHFGHPLISIYYICLRRLLFIPFLVMSARME